MLGAGCVLRSDRSQRRWRAAVAGHMHAGTDAGESCFVWLSMDRQVAAEGRAHLVGVLAAHEALSRERPVIAPSRPDDDPLASAAVA